ncbi:MAG: hypothetical protein U0S48_04295 [Solirubrobacteraceae bacterium]
MATLGVVLVALAVGACGGGDASSSSAGAGTNGSDSGSRNGFMNAEVRDCLKKAGVDLPQPRQGAGEGPASTVPEGGDGPPSGAPPEGGFPGQGGDLSQQDREALQAALKKCGVDVRPGQAGGRAPDIDDAAYQQRVRDYVACVRDNGYDLPDPDFSGNGPVFDDKEVDRTSQAFQDASRKCQDRLRPPTSATTTPSAS